MNPMTNIKNVLKLSERDLKAGGKSSWHDMYKGSAWIFVGGLPYDLTEGDAICVFSQYGEIVNINMVRDKATGKQKGFCFICYEDQRSTILAVDNLNGIKILGRTIRVDHVADYKVPKENDKMDDETKRLQMEGCAPIAQIPQDRLKHESKPKSSGFIEKDEDIKLPIRLPIGNHNNDETLESRSRHKIKKEKKKLKRIKKLKKEKKTKKKKRKRSSSTSSRSDK